MCLDRQKLTDETRDFTGTGGVSGENRHAGFAPAFRDTRSGRVYRSRYADGRPAPVHVLDGLPEELVAQRGADGRVVAGADRLEAGFVRDGRFYTREEAARWLARHESGPADAAVEIA